MDTRINTLFIGKVLLNYERLDSTNSQAERLVKEKKVAEGTVIFTLDQYLGRGQMGNTWLSDTNKNLTMSIILYPKIDFPKHQFVLNQIISLGIRSGLASLGIEDVQIKWPNDILIQGKKVAGILIQNTISKKSISTSIIGIGLNVNQEVFPKEIGKPTSLFIETQNKYEITTVLSVLCHHIEFWYLRMKAGKYKEIEQSYLDYLYLKDVVSLFKDAKGEVFKGTILGISSTTGMLNVAIENGVVRSFMFKEISFL